MTILGNYGRLGNQLFQYAMLKSVSHKLGYELKIPNFESSNWHGQKCLLGNFTLSCSYLTNEDLKKIKKKYHEKNPRQFESDVFNISDNTDFSGIFLDKRYFIEYSDIIKKDLNFISSLENYATEYINNIRKDIGEDTEIVSVHLRRGDNTDGTNPELSNYYGDNNTSIENSVFGEYFYRAKKFFENKKVVYLVFTGGSRLSDNNSEDVNWCKNNLKGDLYYYSENNSSIQDFAIMSMCDHNIVGHETTFSWWAAFLNKNKNKIVIAPKRGIVDEGDKNSDFYPDDFNVI
jgi:hypothetical protein